MWLHKCVKGLQHGGIFPTGVKCALDGSLPVSAISCKVIMEYGGSWSLENNRFGRVWGFVTQRSECRTHKCFQSISLNCIFLHTRTGRQNIFTLIIPNNSHQCVSGIIEMAGKIAANYFNVHFWLICCCFTPWKRLCLHETLSSDFRASHAGSSSLHFHFRIKLWTCAVQVSVHGF